jgi:hypothetical protein
MTPRQKVKRQDHLTATARAFILLHDDLIGFSNLVNQRFFDAR